MDFDVEPIEAELMRPGVDGELLFLGAPTPQLAAAKRAWSALPAARAGQAGDLQSAVAAVKGIDPAQKDTPAAVAYVVAWVRLRQGDFTGAAKAMDAALAGWTMKSALAVVQREHMALHALAGSDVAQVAAAQGSGGAALPGPLLLRLADEYAQLGDQPRRLAALQLAQGSADETTLATIRDSEIKAELSRDHPERVVALLRAQLAQVAKQVEDQARSYELLYRAGQDERYRAAALNLYSTLLGVPVSPGTSDLKARIAALDAARPGEAGARLPPLPARQILRRHIGEVTGCYHRSLQTDPALQGELRLQLVVAPDGTPTQVTVTPQRPADPKLLGLGQCIAKQAKTWRFPRCEQTTVTQPFTFRSVQ